MVYRGRVKNGVVVRDEPARLPEGCEVQVQLMAEVPAERAADEIPTLYERLEPVIGAARGLPADLSEQHDHYLHGQPKK